MKTKKIIINSLSSASMQRVLLVFENGQQVSFWVGEDMEHEHLVETLLAAVSDIVYKVKREENEYSQSQNSQDN